MCFHVNSRKIQVWLNKHEAINEDSEDQEQEEIQDSEQEAHFIYIWNKALKPHSLYIFSDVPTL